VGGDDTFGRDGPVGQGQRKAVRNIRLDREHKSFFIPAIAKHRLNLVLATKSGGVHPVHSVNYSHRSAIHKNGRQSVI
jgi:hypothetical protein